jgi:SEC-C motif-containing protein
MNNRCPCGSNLPYHECCDLIISAKKEAVTCLELMRSRYTAFTAANVDYLMLSHQFRHKTDKGAQKPQKVDGIGSVDGAGHSKY